MKVYINGRLIGESIDAQFDYSATEDVARFVIPIDYKTTAIELQESREENKRLRELLQKSEQAILDHSSRDCEFCATLLDEISAALEGK